MMAELLEIDPHELCDTELAAGLLDLYRLQRRFDAAQRAFVAVAAQRGFWAGDGAVSLAAWIEQRAGVPQSQVTASLRLGRAMQTLPYAAAAGLSSAQMQLIVSCEPTDSEQEMLLVGFARQHPWRELVRLTRHWRALRDADGHEPSAEPAHGSLHLSKLPDGWWDLHGRLRPDQGDLVAAGLDTQVDQRLRARRDGDPADTGQPVSALRADALVDLIAQTMRREPSDASAPDRYRVAVIVHPEQPTSGAPPSQRTPDGAAPGRPTPGGAAPGRPAPRAEHCDASFYRAVINAAGEVLDIGRETRRWPTPIRRAITLRDDGCAFPGCDRPPSWCDIHHNQPWDHGGTTCLTNGVMLCRKHHTFIHTQHWTIETNPDGRHTFRKPDHTIFLITPIGYTNPNNKHETRGNNICQTRHDGQAADTAHRAPHYATAT